MGPQLSAVGLLAPDPTSLLPYLCKYKIELVL